MRPIQAEGLRPRETAVTLTEQEIRALRIGLSLAIEMINTLHASNAAAYEAGHAPGHEHTSKFMKQAADMGNLLNQFMASDFKYTP